MPSGPFTWGALGPQSLQTGAIQLSNNQFISNNGALNYIVNNVFETNTTTGWSLGNVTLTSTLPTGTPTFGSGASGNLSIATTASSPISGTYSLSYASSAATTAGNFLASDAFTIMAADQAKVMTFSFYYQATSGASNCNFSGTSSNSFGVAIYDVTNAAWIIPAGVYSMTQGSGVGYATGTFQTSSNGTSYRLVIYNANATAGAATLYFDRVFLGPQTAPTGVPVTDWASYTPGSQGLGTLTVTNAQWRRVGSNVQLVGTFTIATPTAAEARLNLPPGLTSASTIYSSGTTSTQAGPPLTNNMGSASLIIPLIQASRTYINFGLQNAASNGYVAANGNAIFSSGSFTLLAEFPIQGWSSNTQVSNDTDTRVISARVTGATATLTGSYSDVTWTTVVNDTSGSMGAINYTVPVSGYYNFTGQLYAAAATVAAGQAFNIRLFNTTTNAAILEKSFVYQGTNTTSTAFDFSFQSVLLNAGTQVKIQASAGTTTPAITASATQNFLGINRECGPAVVAATESVNTRWFSSSTAISGTPATVVWTTRSYDTHNAMNGSTGVYTAPVSGKYSVTSSVRLGHVSLGAGNALVMTFQKNGADYSSYNNAAGSTATQRTLTLTDVIDCNAGDTIQVQVSSQGTTPTIAVNTLLNFVDIVRVGN